MGYFILGIWVTLLICGRIATFEKADFVEREERGLFIFLISVFTLTVLFIGAHLGQLGILNTNWW